MSIFTKEKWPIVSPPLKMSKASKTPLNINVAIRAKRGDELAFGEIFDHFYPEIYGFVTNQCHDSTLDIADLTQMVFVKAARSIQQLQSPEYLRAWLYTIAKSCIIDARRKQARDQKLHVALVEAQDRSHVEPEKATCALIHDWISQLREPMREVVTLVYIQGLNHREAGEVMGCAEGTISWRISEAVKSLRTIATQERKSEV